MIDPDQLMEVAILLAEPPPRGAPRQVKLRRAISTTYYALFHFLINRAVGEIVGANADWPRYRMVYRSFLHGDMRAACQQATAALSTESQRVLEITAFCPEIRVCAQTFIELQKLRHEADYDPGVKMTLSDTRTVIAKAQAAIQSLNAAPQFEQRLFLLSLHFKVRS